MIPQPIKENIYTITVLTLPLIYWYITHQIQKTKQKQTTQTNT